MKNESHNTNYLLLCSRFKLPQRSQFWRLHESEKEAEYQNFIKEHCANNVIPSFVEDALKNLKDCLVTRVDKVCGKIKGG